ncbi:hypothetical protein H0H93_011185, partial [Arthromyces matolae]
MHRAKYPLAIIAQALSVFGRQQLVGYDIGCEFQTTIGSSSLGSEFARLECRTCVNAFHGYSHNYLCQLQHHPNSIDGMGLEDLETLERVFSASNALASITRYMTPHRRRVFIDLYFQQWDSDKYTNLGIMLFQNYNQALAIIKDNTVDVDHVLGLRHMTEQELVGLIAEEREYFKTLGTRSDGDLHAIAYVELLEELRVVQSNYDSASSLFRTQTPADYQFISPDRQYGDNVSSTRKTDTSRRHLAERRDNLLHEIIQLEDKMGILTRWTPLHPEYQSTKKFIAERQYQDALLRLQQLVIKRLFELHKLNLSHTAYKMRTHMAKSLQSRSKAIRTAVNKYNTIAVTVNKPTLDWAKVTHYSFLDEFELLRDTQNDLRERKWADPVIRETMRKYQRLKRAHEEILRCNVELRRLHTSIADETTLFNDIHSSLNPESNPLHGEVEEFITRRTGVNRQLMARITQVYQLPGFSGTPSPGTRKGQIKVNTSSIINEETDRATGGDGELSEASDEDELEDEVVAE